ncbi:hypothetical protein [Listeria fleischmannii]|uniref:hypothetical protein n=1 Tax=Listeria fleischmannii TaxID=1069827 RepID=UPI0020B82198|nr:hypothetical protein [Listeria fleischmannii]
MMKLYKRGKRVRYRDQQLIVRTALIIGIPIALLINFILVKQFIKWPSIPYRLDSSAWLTYIKELPYAQFGSFFFNQFGCGIWTINRFALFICVPILPHAESTVISSIYCATRFF